MSAVASKVDVSATYRALGKRGGPALRYLVLGGVVSVFHTLVFAGQVFAVAYGLDGVFLGDLGLAELTYPLAILVGLTLGRALLVGLRRRLDEEAGLVMGEQIFSQLVARTIAGSAAKGSDTAWLSTAATEGVARVETFFSRFIPRAIDMVVVPLVLLVVVAFADLFSAFVLLLTAPLIPIFMVLIGKRAEQRTADQWQAFERLSRHFLDSLQGVTTLQVFGRLADHPRRLARSAETLRKGTMSVLRVAFLSSMVLELAASLSTAIIAVEIGVRLVEGWMGFLPGLFVLLVVPEFYMAFRRFGSEHHTGMEAAAGAAPILALLNSPDREEERRRAGKGRFLSAPPEIAVDGLTLRWPGDGRKIIDDMSLECPAGKLTVIRAPSGGGKSTLAAALSGTLAPEAGQILWDGDNRRPEPEAIAFAPQRPYLFAASIAENLRVARPEAEDEDLWEVLEQVGLAKRFGATGQGLATVISEAGQTLSGGERHRLAVARALLREAPVVILDEPSAQLDEATQQQLIAALLARRARSTVVVFSHRQAIFEAADKVIDLEERKADSAGEEVA